MEPLPPNPRRNPSQRTKPSCLEILLSSNSDHFSLSCLSLLLAEAKELVEQLNLADRILFLGALTQAEISALMRHLRLFALHLLVASDGDSQENPVAVMQAQSSGLLVMDMRRAGSLKW